MQHTGHAMRNASQMFYDLSCNGVNESLSM